MTKKNTFAMDGYVDVAARIALLREKHPEASLQPVDPAQPYTIVEVQGKTFVVYAAACYRSPDDPRPGIGVAWEPWPGPTPYTRDSELQNAETSAWGRAIVAALAADTSAGGVASAEEVRNRRAGPALDQAMIEATRARLGAFLEGQEYDGNEAWVRYKAATSPVWPYDVPTCQAINSFITGFEAALGINPPAVESDGPAPAEPEAEPEQADEAPFL